MIIICIDIYTYCRLVGWNIWYAPSKMATASWWEFQRIPITFSIFCRVLGGRGPKLCYGPSKTKDGWPKFWTSNRTSHCHDPRKNQIPFPKLKCGENHLPSPFWAVPCWLKGTYLKCFLGSEYEGFYIDWLGNINSLEETRTKLLNGDH